MAMAKDVTLPALPERLRLPRELEGRILNSERGIDYLWNDMRCGACAFLSVQSMLNVFVVCRAWRDHIEHRARTRWIRDGWIRFPVGGFNVRSAPRMTIC